MFSFETSVQPVQFLPTMIDEISQTLQLIRSSRGELIEMVDLLSGIMQFSFQFLNMSFQQLIQTDEVLGLLKRQTAQPNALSHLFLSSTFFIFVLLLDFRRGFAFGESKSDNFIHFLVGFAGILLNFFGHAEGRKLGFTPGLDDLA